MTLIKDLMETTTSASGLHRRRGLLLPVAVIAAVLVFGVLQVKDSLGGMNRSTALLSPVYEASASSVKEKYDEQQIVKQGNHGERSGASGEEYNSTDPNATRRIAFVKVGQSGGATISRTFPRLKCRQSGSNRQSPELLKECFQKYRREDSPLSSQLELEMHLTKTPPRDLKDYTTFMFSIRNPLTRTVSAYSRLHHNNTKHVFARRGHHLEHNFYNLCFPSLAHLLRAVEYISNPEMAVDDRNRDPTEIPTEKSEYCQLMAIATLKGKNPLVEKINAHLRCNHLFYYDETIGAFPDKEIVAVRMEHLQDDIKALDIGMGGKGALHINADDFAKEIWKSSEVPTSNQWKDLCCILWEDIETYQRIVNHARNLDYSSKLETMNDVWNTCGVNAGDRNQFEVEDTRTTTSNAKAREGNSQIVLFSWQRWHGTTCASNRLERHKFSLADPPPAGLIPSS